MRGLTGDLQVATSNDGGITWDNFITHAMMFPCFMFKWRRLIRFKDGKEYVLLANANGPGRKNNTFEWLA